VLYSLRARLTILRDRSSPDPAADVLALAALGWVLQDESRAERLLALTGLTPDELRAGSAIRRSWRRSRLPLRPRARPRRGGRGVGVEPAETGPRRGGSKR
jgi:hypothetical protein